MRFISLTTFVTAIVLGCSSVQKTTLPPETERLPPELAQWSTSADLSRKKDFYSVDLFLNRVAKENNNTQTLWWADYRRAQLWVKKDKNVACENFARLAADPLFPARTIAFLRAHEICPQDNQILSRLEAFQLDKFDPWLNESALDVAIFKAQQINDRRLLVDLYLRKSKLNLRKEEKIELTQKALALAQKLANKNAEKNTEKNKVKELEARLHNLSPKLIPAPQPRDYLNIAADFRYNRDFEKSREYYDKIIKSKTTSISDKLQAYRGIRSTYRIEQRRAEAVKATEKLAQFVEDYYKNSKKFANDAKLHLDTQLVLARTYWTENQIQQARKTLDIAAQAVGDKTSLAEVYWMFGRMDEENQNFSGAADWFQKALDQPIETAQFRDKITWYLAWNQRKLKNFGEATKLLSALETRTENNLERGRYLFWLAKVYQEMGEATDAKKQFLSITEDDPFSFYGLLAHREANIELPTKRLRREDLKKKKIEKEMIHELRAHMDLAYFEWLVAVREDEIAKNYLDFVAQKFRRDRYTDIERWTALLHLYGKSNNYLQLFTQLGQLDSTMRRTILQDNPDLIFPNPYLEVVTDSASRFGVSTEFIYSVMRQESSFNPQARSQMDAFGLMQLLPEVAQRSAEANAIEYSQPEDLFDPHINIPIGSAHLRELWDKYNGELVLAVASYNANEKAILNWLKTRYRGDTLEFIEDIPYDETRDYVKLVMRNLLSYQIINSQENSIRFPEWTLKISYQNSPQN